MKVRTNKRGDAWCAHLEPIDGVYVGAAGPDAASALHQAARLLDHALERPEVQSVLPPGTLVAVKLLRGATAAIRKGRLPDYLSSLPSGAASVVTRTLRKVLPW